MATVEDVADSLLRIEIELRALAVWSSEPPSEDAMQSTQPFSVDTLQFTEWLQFVFLPRMSALVEAGRQLPTTSGIAPMAEEHFRGRELNGDALIRELMVIDYLLSDD
jgi:uncharacterized protein YqcC (DUF446 family)